MLIFVEKKVKLYKRRKGERFETVEIQNYDESETNNNDKKKLAYNSARYARSSEPS